MDLYLVTTLYDNKNISYILNINEVKFVSKKIFIGLRKTFY